MTSSDPRSTSQLSAQAGNAFRASIILLIAILLIATNTTFSFINNFRQGTLTAQVMVATVVPFLVTATAVAGAWVSRRGKAALAGWLLIGGSLAGLLTSPFTGPGFGMVYAIAALVATSVIAGQTLPRRQAGWAILVAAVVGALTFLIDLYNPAEPLTSTSQIFAVVVLSGLLVIFGLITLRQFSSYTLRTKLIITFLVISLTPTIALALLNLQSTRTTLTSASNASLLGAASQTANAIDSFMEVNKTAVRTEAQLLDFVVFISQDPQVARLNTELRDKVAASLVVLTRKDPEHILSYALLDNTFGFVMLDTLPGTLGTAEGDKEHYITVKTTHQAYVSPVNLAPDGTASFVISAPILDAEGQLLGVMRARYNASVLQDLIAQSSGVAGAESYAFLLDENGFRLADGKRPDLAFTATTWLSDERLAELRVEDRIPLASMQQLYNNLPDLEQMLGLANTQTATFAAVAYPDEGLSQGAVVSLRTQPWRIVYVQPQTVFLQPVEEQTGLNVIVALVIAAVVVASAIGLAQVLAAPINRLTETAEKVRAGDLYAEAQVEAQDEIGELATTFNGMTGQLRASLAGLEQRVADRTRALALSAEISRRLSGILDQEQLVTEVVEQLRSSFNYYHVHIYLYDERRENLVMVGGTGEAARTMLARGHHLEEGRGLVGRAAGTNSPVLVPDVSKDPGWVPNPLLPDTKAEMAVPITVGVKVMGVLDVQHNVVNGLKLDDIQLIQSVSSQMAIALQNTMSFKQSQYDAQRETIINAVTEKIQRATTVENVLEIAARELGQALKAQRANASISRTHLKTNRENNNGH